VNLFSVKDKIILITGAGRGIGLALARGFREAGAMVCGSVRSPEARARICRELEIEEEGVFIGDITDCSFQEDMVREIIRRHGRIDVLVNNAGFTRSNPAETYPLEDWNRTLDVNLKAVFQLCQVVGREMIKQKQGAIINVTSIGSLTGFPENPAYLASKGGLRLLTKGLARDWARHGIRVNNLCPGYIKTDMTMQGYNDPVKYAERINRVLIKRFGEPEDLIGPAIFLASEASGYITGADLVVDGGWLANGL